MRCNCENSACEHPPGLCKRIPNLGKRIRDLGIVCFSCWFKYPAQYRISHTEGK